MIRISIVTAVFNRKETVKSSLDSIEEQVFSDFEHIIQDGASTDGTLEYLQARLDCRTKIVSEPDNGIYQALNRGIRRATGDIIGVLHSDDMFASPNVLSLIDDAFQKHDVDAVYGDLEYVGAEDTNRVIRYWRAGNWSREKLRYGWMPPHPTFFARRHVFEQYGLYDETFTVAADYDAMLRYFGKYNIKVHYIPEVLVKMRVGGESNKSLSKILHKSREDLRALRQNEMGGGLTLLGKNVRKIDQFVRRRAN